jgi:dihydroorotase-like cyclic amidohydrolase
MSEETINMINNKEFYNNKRQFDNEFEIASDKIKAARENFKKQQEESQIIFDKKSLDMQNRIAFGQILNSVLAANGRNTLEVFNR